jgi:hypothetical protein
MEFEMANIAFGTSTVGEVLAAVEDQLLDGVFAERRSTATKRDIVRNDAQRAAVKYAFDELRRVWCADADTLFVAVPTPSSFEV